MKCSSVSLVLFLFMNQAFGNGLVTGTATYREPIALPPDAVFEASVEDVSRADAPAEVVGQVRIEAPGNPPIRFEIAYDEARIQQNHAYSVRARILSEGSLMFVTDRSYPVLTRGQGQDAALTMRKVGGMPLPQKNVSSQTLAPLPASFAGKLPCADCPGILCQLDLFPDRVFFQRMDYLEKDRSFDRIGAWAISPDGKTLILKTGHEAPIRFAIKDDSTLRKLDVEGREVPSAHNSDLKREASLPAIEPRLAMTGMYRYMADAGIFTECLTRRRMPVAQDRDNAALEAAYGKLRSQAGEEIPAKLEGRIAMRPKMEGDGLQPVLVVERFIGLSPRENCGAQFSTANLENTYWKLTRLGDEPVTLSEKQREPHLLLRSEDRRVSGFSGCNRLMSRYELDGDKLAVGKTASTMMACPLGMDTEKAFLQALEQVKTWKIVDEHLELFDASGKPLARFEAVYLR